MNQEDTCALHGTNPKEVDPRKRTKQDSTQSSRRLAKIAKDDSLSHGKGKSAIGCKGNYIIKVVFLKYDKEYL